MRALGKRPDVELVGVYEPDATLREQFRAAARPRRREDVRRSRHAADEGAARGGRRLHQHLRSPRRDSRRGRARRARDGGEAARGVERAGPRHPAGGGRGPHPRHRQLRDHLVCEPSHGLGDDARAAGRRRDSQDGGDGRARGAERDQRAAGVSRLAARSGAQRRRRALRLRLLRRQPHDLADGRPAAARGHRGDAALQARDLSEGGRRGLDPRGVSGRAGHHRRRRGTGRSAARTSKSTASAPT